jgi:hypothetical protein
MELSNIPVNIDADLQELIPKFLDNRRIDIVALKTFISENEEDAIAHLAHKIKGSAAGYGFIGLSEMALDIENALKNHEPEKLPRIADEMASYLEKIKISYIAF